MSGVTVIFERVATSSRTTRSPGRGRAKGRAPVRARRQRGRSTVGRISSGTILIVLALIVAVVYGISRIDVGEKFTELTLPLQHEDIIRQQADEKQVPADLIAAVIYAESRFHDQTSDAGARGLMQITPETGDTIEKLSGGETFNYDDLSDPELNIRYGTFLLHTCSTATTATSSRRSPPTTPGPATSTRGAGPRCGPTTSRFRRRRTTSRRSSTSARRTATSTRTSSVCSRVSRGPAGLRAGAVDERRPARRITQRFPELQRRRPPGPPGGRELQRQPRPQRRHGNLLVALGVERHVHVCGVDGGEHAEDPPAGERVPGRAGITASPPTISATPLQRTSSRWAGR